MPSPIIRLLEAMAPLGAVEDRPYLGGWGLYLGGRMFALMQGEKIWFRTDQGSRLEYLRSGSSPFATNPSMELGWFYEVPPAVRDDEYQLVAWARKAVEAK